MRPPLTLTRAVGAALVVLGLGQALPAPPAGADALDPAARRAIEEIVRDYIKAHPEAIEASLQQLEERRQEETKRRGREAVAAHQADLLHDPESPVHGNPTGDVTLVEFFDYRCRYCRAVAGFVTQLIKEDPQLRLVYKDFPILGEASVMASKAALASRVQGKYAAFHEALMAVQGELTEATVMATAASVGLDTTKLQADMEAPAIMAVIERNRALGEMLGLTGTPAFVVGGELAPGAMDLAAMKELVSRARAK
jgi:protein-disulfide isomerase